MQEEKHWVRTFVKWFFRALIPLVGLLFMAILRRISDYGVTEPRYLVLMMAIGLVIVVIYFLISKVKDIRIIPILLCVASLLAAFGPWSASAVSLRSQQSRLETLLNQNGMLQDGLTQKAEQELTLEDRKEMSSIIDYVCMWHGPEPFSKWLGEDAIDSLDSDKRSTQRKEIAELFGFEWVSQHGGLESGSRFWINNEVQNISVELRVVTGYDYMVNYSLTGGDYFRSVLLDTDSCFVSFDTATAILKVNFGTDRNDSTGTIWFPLSDTLNSLVAEYNKATAPLSACTFIRSGSFYEVRLVLERIFGNRESDGLQIKTFEGYLLLRRHPSQ